MQTMSIFKLANDTYSGGMSEMRIFNLNPELRQAFKLLCVQRRVSMNQAVINLIRKEVDEAGIKVDFYAKTD